MATESNLERERRAWIEHEERFKDETEKYEQKLGVVASPEERDRLQEAFGKRRQAHREMSVQMGKRSPGTAVEGQQIMWARWIEVAVEHELEARRAFRDILARPSSDPLGKEFRASLVAVTAAAHTIEAVYGEVKYLIPPQPPRDKRHKELRHAFREAFGLSGRPDEQLGGALSWLFVRRDSAAHPYTESMPMRQHPAGINTGIEHSYFNACTSGDAVDISMRVLELAALPPNPLCRWVERWAIERAPYHGAIQELRAVRDAEPRPDCG